MAKSNEIDLNTQRYEYQRAMTGLAKAQGAKVDGLPIDMEGNFDFNGPDAPVGNEIKWVKVEGGPMPKDRNSNPYGDDYGSGGH